MIIAAVFVSDTELCLKFVAMETMQVLDVCGNGSYVSASCLLQWKLCKCLMFTAVLAVQVLLKL